MSDELFHFIGGKPVFGTSGRFCELPGIRVPLAGKREVGYAVEVAVAAQDEWALWQPDRRLRGLMDFLERVSDELDGCPVMVPVWNAAPAIACGNSFVLKPSERDPSIALRLATTFLDAGLPPGVFNVINGDREAIDALIAHPRVDAIGFVGPSAVAESVQATALAYGKTAQCFHGTRSHLVPVPEPDTDEVVGALVGAGTGPATEAQMATSLVAQFADRAPDPVVERLAAVYRPDFRRSAGSR
ncbi:aldehyde dehydrogenase family protein [Amycolatopsis sp. NPDC059657]|uniref:aldehyde dehydrogenase family protein n=1 Tax=Amycolatopsis sp. NPDC059657 TaxID=3346899 RepID=UPI00366ADD02